MPPQEDRDGQSKQQVEMVDLLNNTNEENQVEIEGKEIGFKKEDVAA